MTLLTSRARDGGRFSRQKDPTFDSGTELALTTKAIDEEGTGFFLVPASVPQDPSWRDATPDEARAVYGMGSTASSSPGHETQGDQSSGGCGGSSTSPSFNATPTQPANVGAPGPAGHMCAARAYTMEVSLNLNDTPVGYAPPIGPPVFARVTYNQREADQPSVFTYFNVSPKWNLNFLSFVQDNLTSGIGVGVTRYVNGGGYVPYAGYNGTTGQFTQEEQTGSILTRSPATGTLVNYTLTAVDGSKLVYARPDGALSGIRNVFLTSIVDAQGNALTLNYASVATDAEPDGGTACPAGGCQVLTSITDATNGVTTFTYGFAANPLLITQITDPFGRSATLAYDGQGRLQTSTDTLGIASTYGYDDSTGGDPSFVTSLTTPYGKSTFNEFFSGTTACTGTNRCLEMSDPLGQTERVEYRDVAPGIAFSDTVAPAATGFGTWNQYLDYRSSYYWDRNSYPAFGTGTGKDYTKAVHYHFLHTSDGAQTAWTLESIQRPLENRIWYMHYGQVPTGSSPALEATLDAVTAQARIMDDGSTQIATGTNNALGFPTQAVDPLGRTLTYAYAANNIDLLTVSQQVSASPAFATLAALGDYNGQHEPGTATDASGQTTRYAYSTAGQLTRVTDVLGNATSYNYDALGRLVTVLDANGKTTQTLDYPSGCDANPGGANCDLPQSATDAVGFTTSYIYDAFDRVTEIDYPDKTSQKYVYTNLDMTSWTDRLGQITNYVYDANQRLTSVSDPLTQVTKYGYYPNGTLKSITDPNNNTTTWDVDLQSRPTTKHYADGTTEIYTYENTTSRLKSKTDGFGQVMTYAYNQDDSLAAVTYSGSAVAQVTPLVSFTYDPVFARLTGMTDGVGTTTYNYYPLAAAPAPGPDAGVAAVPMALGAGRLQFVASPVAGATGGAVDVVSYSYDALGRVNGRSVNGASQGVMFDQLGRPTAVTNALDAFAYGYSDETPRPTSVASANGPSLALTYYDPAAHPEQNELLQQMTYSAPGGGQVLSQFGYGYDVNGNVKTFTATHLGPPPVTGTPADSGEMGMNGPRLLKGHRGGAKLASSAWTRTRLGTRGNGGVLIWAAGLLLAEIAWVRSPRRRMASALVPLALGFIFAACGSGDDNSDNVPSADAGADARAAPDASLRDGSVPEAGGEGGENDSGLALQTQVTSYQYDPASRLISATLGTGGMPPDPSATPQYAYGYDPASNPTSIAANGATQTPAYNSTNEIIGGNYDPNGSPKVLDGSTYTWDGANRLVSATLNGVESDFTYDGQSRIVRIVSKQGA